MTSTQTNQTSLHTCVHRLRLGEAGSLPETNSWQEAFSSIASTSFFGGMLAFSYSQWENMVGVRAGLAGWSGARLAPPKLQREQGTSDGFPPSCRKTRVSGLDLMDFLETIANLKVFFSHANWFTPAANAAKTARGSRQTGLAPRCARS